MVTAEVRDLDVDVGRRLARREPSRLPADDAGPYLIGARFRGECVMRTPWAVASDIEASPFTC
jgi:hypothetical protein